MKRKNNQKKSNTKGKDKNKNYRKKPEKSAFYCPLCKYRTNEFDTLDIHLHSNGHVKKEKEQIGKQSFYNSSFLKILERVNDRSFSYLRQERAEEDHVEIPKRKHDEIGDGENEQVFTKKRRVDDHIPRYQYHFEDGILGDDGWVSENENVDVTNYQVDVPETESQTKIEKKEDVFTQFNFFQGIDVDNVPEFIPLDRPDEVTAPSRRIYGAIDGANYERPNLTQPLWQKKDYQVGIDGLHAEILEFMEYMKPTEAEVEMREYVLDKVIKATKELWPDCSVECFGSYACDLYLPTSDIDIAIWDIPGKKPDILYDLANKLERRGVAESYDIEVIDSAKVPVVKFKEKVTQTQVDIVMNIQNGRLNTQTIENILSAYPVAKPLIIFIKYFLYLRGLNEPYTGGLGSYSVVLLMTSFLQVQENLSKKNAEEDLGLLLIGFLKLYGQDFNFYLLGISVREGGYFMKKTKGWMDYGRPQLPAIEDPNDPNNNVGASSRSISIITQAFRSAYQKLATQPNKSYEYSETLLSRVIFMDPEFPRRRGEVEAMYKNGDF